MKNLVVNSLSIGEGRPKICLPIIGTTEEEVLLSGQKIAGMRGTGADLCEWRIDWFDEVWNFPKLVQTGHLLRKILNGMPLLVTFRTKEEGGERECSRSRYTELICKICAAGFADLIDIELFSGDCRVTEMMGAAAQYQVKTILSSHDFDKTPSEEEIISRLARMEALGADLAKIAVMPRSREDVIRLLSASVRRSKESKIPLITMSMGNLGAVSRICGELTGSAVTFGTLGASSAPGQIPAEKLSDILETLAIT